MKKYFALCALVVACGGSAAPSAASPSPASDSTMKGGQAAPESTQQSTPTTSTSNTSNTRTPEVSAARSELDSAEQRLGSSQGDCAAACRALASMERAAEHLCQLDTGSECGRARERVEAARERVRSTCGGCGS